MIAELYDEVLLMPGPFFGALVRKLEPAYVIELGTGAGHTAAQIMEALPDDSSFATINWPNPPSGDDVGRELCPWGHDRRLTQILGDTRDPHVAFQVDSGIDLLYIDSGTEHTCALISAEWEVYESKLADGAVVVVDDIDHNDMRKFWDPLPYEKVEMFGGRMGMFLYRRVA